MIVVGNVSVAAAMAAAVAAAVAAAATTSTDHVLLNEVLYDAAGSDRGHEFVELHCAAGGPVPLAAYALERGNGARPDDWRCVWQGTASDTVWPASFFVIGGEEVDPPPHAIAELGLQNGPDACRLLRDGAVVDLVGWGEHVHGEYAEGEPAPLVAAGASLGRIPDGADSDDNAADWQALAEPGPGARNRARPPFVVRSAGHRSTGQGLFAVEIDWRVEAVTAALPEPLQLSVHDCGQAQLVAGPETVGGGSAEEVHGTIQVRDLPAGITCLRLVAAAAAHADTLALAIRAGPGPLLITEIMARPPAGAPEWIEVANASDDPLALDGFAIADARLQPVSLSAGSWTPGFDGRLAPGEPAVIAAGAVAADAPVLVLENWPALNDGGDRVRVIDAGGRTSDDVPFAASWLEAGASIVRLAFDLPSEDRASWIPEIGGSPGRLADPAPRSGDGFISITRPAARGGPLILHLATPLRSGRLRIHALDGRRIAEVTGASISGRSRWVWSGCDDAGETLPPGLYLFDLEGETWHGEQAVSVRTATWWSP
jgi:hypothetical protein